MFMNAEKFTNVNFRLLQHSEYPVKWVIVIFQCNLIWYDTTESRSTSGMVMNHL